MKAILVGGKSHLREFEIGADERHKLPDRWYMPVMLDIRALMQRAREGGYYVTDSEISTVMETEEYRLERIMAGRAFYVAADE